MAPCICGRARAGGATGGSPPPRPRSRSFFSSPYSSMWAFVFSVFLLCSLVSLEYIRGGEEKGAIRIVMGSVWPIVGLENGEHIAYRSDGGIECRAVGNVG